MPYRGVSRAPEIPVCRQKLTPALSGACRLPPEGKIFLARTVGVNGWTNLVISEEMEKAKFSIRKLSGGGYSWLLCSFLVIVYSVFPQTRVNVNTSHLYRHWHDWDPVRRGQGGLRKTTPVQLPCCHDPRWCASWYEGQMFCWTEGRWCAGKMQLPNNWTHWLLRDVEVMFSTLYAVFSLFATRFALCPGGIWVTFIEALWPALRGHKIEWLLYTGFTVIA